MSPTVFWDCGGQFDLADIDGKLYVPGAVTIRARLARLAAHARSLGTPRIALLVTHQPGDPDIAEKPDYKASFPAHCLAGTPGHRQVPELAFAQPVVIARDKQDRNAVIDRVRAGRDEIAVEIPTFDPWSNPMSEVVLETLGRRRVIAYGIPADRSVVPSIEGLLARGLEVLLVRDACRPFAQPAWDTAIAGWAERVALVSTSDVLTRLS
ncbi:MAG: cysteine hydrolase family protein [Acidobacteria bacterium]|nr:cysteine hydrolase family protein [Acidobacteriota bacterium]